MFLLPTRRRVVENRKYLYHAVYTTKTFRMCDTTHWMYKSNRKKKKTKMLTILTLSTQTAAIDLSSTAGPCENRSFVRPSGKTLLICGL